MHFFFLQTLFIFRGERREKEKERNINVWLPLVHTPNWGPGLQPRHVPWLGIEPVTLWFTGWCSVFWATPTRAFSCISYKHLKILFLWYIHNWNIFNSLLFMLLQLSQFFPLCLPPPILSPLPWPWVMHVFSLTFLFRSFFNVPSLPCSSLSVCFMFLCLWFSFGH